MRGRGVTRRLLACALGVVVPLATACVRPRPIAAPASPVDARAVVSALAAREQALPGRRVAMTVRSLDTPALLASPAYLAVDGPEALRLQVLSPVGVTVLTLTIRDGAYELTLPLRGETRRGAIDFAALATPELPASERMVIALALLFRPKIQTGSCQAERDSTIACSIAAGMVAHVTVDAQHRPIDERYTAADGAELVRARYDDYADDRPDALARRIEIHDAPSGARMVARVLRTRTAGAEATR